jgi:hypothetical protein
LLLDCDPLDLVIDAPACRDVLAGNEDGGLVQVELDLLYASLGCCPFVTCIRNVEGCGLLADG